MATYKVRFLISTSSWTQVKKIFSDNLGITKDKKDLSQITKFIDLVKSHKIVMEGSRN